MIRCVIALILMNIYYPSTGLPVPQSVSLSPIASQLKNLTISCENVNISKLIMNQIQHCNITKQIDSKAEFRCLMFFDINSQLCTAFRHSKFNLQENYLAKMSEVQNIKSICDNAMSWQFIYKDQYPKEESVDQVFKDESLCIQICANDEFVSSDSNFFCKYYQWGSELIKSQATNMTSHSSVIAPVYVESNLNPVTNNTTTINALKNDNSKTSTHVSVAKSIESLPEQAKPEAPEVEVPSPDLAKDLSVNQAPLADNSNKITDQSIKSPDVSTKNEIEKPPNKDDEEKSTPLKEAAELKDPQSKDILNDKDRQLDSDDENLDGDNDNEDGVQYDQDMDTKARESDPEIDVKKTNSENNDKKVPLLDSDVKSHKGRVAIESITAVAEKFPNPMQDSFVEDDDHFFPFFLTVIISVVILYILYHNKNKLMKLLLGLLVEGRQPGRRRNSRGHAYRRLDTLEQAMNTNSAAPPSKIIY